MFLQVTFIIKIELNDVIKMYYCESFKIFLIFKITHFTPQLNHEIFKKKIILYFVIYNKYFFCSRRSRWKL